MFSQTQSFSFEVIVLPFFMGGLKICFCFWGKRFYNFVVVGGNAICFNWQLEFKSTMASGFLCGHEKSLEEDFFSCWGLRQGVTQIGVLQVLEMADISKYGKL